MKKNFGFSLLEVLIVTAIMGTIAFFASQSIQNAIRNKKKIDAHLRVESMVFDALRLMATDVERAFHYQFAFYEIDKAALGAAPAVPGAPVIPIPGNGGVGQAQLPPPPERLTQFIGKETSLHFTTLNHQRTVANSQESNQIEVGYYVDGCKARLTGASTSCLWRRTSSIIDNDVTRGGEATALLEDVGEFKLEYRNDDPNNKEWKHDWISDSNGGADTQNMFPYMVKITLSYENKDSKELAKFKQVVIVNVRFPNNNDPAKQFAPNAGTGGLPGAPGGPGGTQ